MWHITHVQTIPLLMPMISTDIPELRQLAALAAVHMLSTWKENQPLAVASNGLRVVGEVLTDRIGGTCAMAHERAILAMIALCDDEAIRRKAFRVGLPDLMLSTLRDGLTLAAIEGACYCITLLVLLQDRQILRACCPALIAMLHASQRLCRLAALRCIIFMAHTDEERTGFAQSGMVDALVELLKSSSQLEMYPHIIRALLALAQLKNAPQMIKEAGAAPPLSRLLRTTNSTVKDLTVQLLLKLDEVPVLEANATDPYIRDNYGDMIKLRRSELDMHMRMLGPYEKPFPKAELDEIRERFVEFDDDGSGSINKDELQALLQSLGIKASKSRCKELIAKVSMGDVGSELEWAEFIHLVHDLRFSKTIFERFTGGVSWLLE